MAVQYTKLVVGIDQSYTRTGISIAADGKLLLVKSIAFKRLKSKSEKRKHLAQVLTRILELNASKAKETLLICERIRTFSHGKGRGKDQFLDSNYIKVTGALIAVIVDVAAEYGLKVYSADTRSWKAQVVGSTKAIKGNKKLAAIQYIEKLGFSVTSINRAGNTVFDDDAADSACIALYGFTAKQHLKLEE